MSYLRRLELANGLPADRTGTSLGIRPGDDMVFMIRVLTGRSSTALRHALPQLGAADPRMAPFLREEPATPHAACELCCRAAGIDQHVRRWVTHEQVICLHHRRWLGSPEEGTADQLDLAGHPDVLAAFRRHRNLIARRGRFAVQDAYETSARIVWDWQLQNRHLPAVSARIDRLRDGRICSHMDPAAHAAQYPTAVALTSLLSSRYWRHQAFNAVEDHVHQFLQEVADTVTDGYYPTGGQDPLRDYVRYGGGGLPVMPRPATRMPADARI